MQSAQGSRVSRRYVSIWLRSNDVILPSRSMLSMWSGMIFGPQKAAIEKRAAEDAKLPQSHGRGGA